jgi:hypothetical protein
MRKLAMPAVVLILAPSAAADGCPPTTCGIYSAATPGARTVAVRTYGERGPLRLYDLVERRQVLTLPPGMRSADGRRFVSVRVVRRTTTVVTTYRLPLGDGVTSRELPGRYALAGVSADGARVVLARTGASAHGTVLTVLDRGAAPRAVRLPGHYELEALSPGKRRLFLIHWLANGYELEHYDLATGELRKTAMLEDGEPEKLVGTPWRGVATRDGRWLLTLYLKGPGAFVHALDLRAGVGHCVDLPVHANPAALGSSALALSPDGRRLFVTSPVLGRVFTIALDRPRVARSARFRPWLGPDELGSGMGPNTAVSPNGRMLYFNGNGLVWAYDIPYGRVRGPYPARRQVMALGVTPDGRRVVAIGGDGRTTSFVAATGRAG